MTESLVEAGYPVRAMVHYNFRGDWGWLEALPRHILNTVEIVLSDIRDPFAVQNAVQGCKIVYHLAALVSIPYSYKAPASFVATNIIGTLNILQACLAADVHRLVHTSTSETYGTAQYVPIDESHPMVAQSPYAATKIGADKLVESYYHTFSLPACTIRPFNTYGPRQSARAVIPTIISQILSGNDTIELGALTPVRDLTYVKDTVAGFIAVGESETGAGRVINVGNGKGIAVGQLAQLLIEICGKPVSIKQSEKRVRPTDSEVFELICNNTRAQSTLHWKPLYSLKSGLEETVAWYRSNFEKYKPHIYNI